jgi:hypothetical protein
MASTNARMAISKILKVSAPRKQTTALKAIPAPMKPVKKISNTTSKKFSSNKQAMAVSQSIINKRNKY